LGFKEKRVVSFDRSFFKKPMSSLRMSLAPIVDKTNQTRPLPPQGPIFYLQEDSSAFPKNQKDFWIQIAGFSLRGRLDIQKAKSKRTSILRSKLPSTIGIKLLTASKIIQHTHTEKECKGIIESKRDRNTKIPPRGMPHYVLA
jgi:hypothetical protein